MSAADRKRRQRERLAEQGLGQVTVTWPLHALAQLREIESDTLARHERALLDGGWPETDPTLALELALRRRQESA